MAISALSPSLLPSLIILVYPPGLSATFTATSLNNSATAFFCFILEKTILLLWVVSDLDFVIKGSTNFFNAFAFAIVVLILLCSISEQAILASIELLCPFFLPK